MGRALRRARARARRCSVIGCASIRFIETPLAGRASSSSSRWRDERGCSRAPSTPSGSRATGWTPRSRSATPRSTPGAGTLRGMHYQAEPHGEAKLVRCVRGAIFDVAVDLRAGSPTPLPLVRLELSARTAARCTSRRLRPRLPDARRRQRGPLPDGPPYVPEAARGVRCDDPAFAIHWPAPSGQRIHLLAGCVVRRLRTAVPAWQRIVGLLSGPTPASREPSRSPLNRSRERMCSPRLARVQPPCAAEHFGSGRSPPARS